MAREEGIECFSSFMRDILNKRERDMKQYLGIFIARITEENISGFSLLLFHGK